jgi:peptidoglycan hydrolase-like protein with peptidoglycan-binding domain
LQQILNCKGYIIAENGVGSKGKETNYFGQKTKEALMKFQKANNLKGDGILGPNTRKILNKITAL